MDWKCKEMKNELLKEYSADFLNELLRDEIWEELEIIAQEKGMNWSNLELERNSNIISHTFENVGENNDN